MSIEFQFISGPPHAQQSLMTAKYFYETMSPRTAKYFYENIREQEFGVSKTIVTIVAIVEKTNMNPGDNNCRNYGNSKKKPGDNNCRNYGNFEEKKYMDPFSSQLSQLWQF